MVRSRLSTDIFTRSTTRRESEASAEYRHLHQIYDQPGMVRPRLSTDIFTRSTTRREAGDNGATALGFHFDVLTVQTLTFGKD